MIHNPACFALLCYACFAFALLLLCFALLVHCFALLSLLGFASQCFAQLGFALLSLALLCLLCCAVLCFAELGFALGFTFFSFA